MPEAEAAAGIASTASDLEILRAFEPVVRYTHGERFFPMDVEPYVEASSLWLYLPDEADEEVIPEGSLSMDELVAARDAAFGSLFYLRFVGPLGLNASARAIGDVRKLAKEHDTSFHAGVGRLARGGLLPRLGDSLFSLSLIFRGNVPGATAAAAVLKYAAMQEQDERYVYHGRVVRQGGWTICQYWFFFAYNDWRSGFYGVNDHESDWEMISVYLYEDEDQLRPEWVAYASHDFHGADLRRRWDDRQDLELVGDHPVVHAGAGSHASYFKRGEYQAEVPIPLPAQVKVLVDSWSSFWRNTLGQGGAEVSTPRIPFIDFARGDGLAVGPGQEKEWTPNLVSEKTAWVSRYRGMWGLFARDPISGENAPGGPMYNRDGSPRPSWFDPLGFAELDQVPPPTRELEVLEGQIAGLEARNAELEELIPEAVAELQKTGSRLSGMTDSAHLEVQHQRVTQQLTEQVAEINDLRLEHAENEALLESLTRRADRAGSGRANHPRAHIRSPMEPVPSSQMRFNRAAELWAAMSISLLLVGIAALVIWAPTNVWAALILFVIAFVVGESVLRGTFARTVNRIAVILALIAAVVLVVQFWRVALIGLLIGFAVFLVSQRIREVRA
jgi:hypothetical protein